MKLLRRIWLVPTIAALACGVQLHRTAIVNREGVPSADYRDTLKVHMNSGELYMLESWSLDTAARKVNGKGRHFDAMRAGRIAMDASIPLDSVALFETHKHESVWLLGTSGVAVFTMAGALISVACLADPKSCFGSCPTFYVEGADSTRVQAEGFSGSVARVLEARDVDAIAWPADGSSRLAIRMRNEAWETHVLRRVNLLVAQRPAGGRVFAASDSVFYSATNIVSPATCSDAGGNCLGAISKPDGHERSSPADSLNLAEREIVELSFTETPERPALVLTARNSLISTFLFYQSMGYVGSNAGAFMASVERGGRAVGESYLGMARLLGTIEVQVERAGEWRTIGEFGEPGPIASDTKVVPLPTDLPPSVPLRVRLRLAKGNWRVDWAAVASLGETVETVRIQPSMVERGDRADRAALAALREGKRRLVTLPGDDYRLVFDLPQSTAPLEVFLESEGYYYEWMRQEWLADENPQMAALALWNPGEALRRLAPAYKAREARMEQLFWDSRYNRPPSQPGAR